MHDYIQSKKHKAGVAAKLSSSSIKDFCRNLKFSSEEQELAAAEGTFAYHMIQHNHSFRSMDCTGKLIKKNYDPKFAMACTKSEAIVVNVLNPYISKTVVDDINESNFVSLAFDTSNHNNIKLAPVLIRHFKPSSGIKTEIAELSAIEGETSERLCEHVLAVVNKYNLQDKIIAILADNTNTNFGGVARAGKNNVHTKLKERLGRDCLALAVVCTLFIILQRQHAINCLLMWKQLSTKYLVTFTSIQ